MKRIALAALAVALPLALAGCPNAKPRPPKTTPKTPDEPEAPDKPKTPDKPKPPPEPAIKLADMKSPWRHAKVGDWVEYNKFFVMGSARFEIVEIKGGTLTYTLKNNTENTTRRIPVDFEDLEKSFNPPEKLVPTPKIELVELKLKSGKTLKCKYYKREGLGTSTETWLCEDIAVNGGIVKNIRGGELQVEISDYHKVE